MENERIREEYTDIGRSVDHQAARAPAPGALDGHYVMLRPLDQSHARDLFEAIGGEDQEFLQRYTADEPVPSEAQMRGVIAAKQAIPAAQYFACIDRESGKASGIACLMRADLPNRVLEIGNVLYSARLRRSRAGTEVVYLLAKHAIEELGFRRVEWKCNDHNAASRHAALRYGFTFEGVFRQHMIVKGHNRDTAWYSMLDREWPQRRDSLEQWLAPENFDASGRQIVSLAQLNGVGGA